MLLLCFGLSIWHSSEQAVDVANYLTGTALVVCARLGMPPEQIRRIFGSPDASHEGRLDWRENPDRYLHWGWSRYNVWVEWDGDRPPRTGTGPIFTNIHGTLE